MKIPAAIIDIGYTHGCVRLQQHVFELQTERSINAGGFQIVADDFFHRVGACIYRPVRCQMSFRTRTDAKGIGHPLIFLGKGEADMNQFLPLVLIQGQARHPKPEIHRSIRDAGFGDGGSLTGGVEKYAHVPGEPFIQGIVEKSQPQTAAPGEGIGERPFHKRNESEAGQIFQGPGFFVMADLEISHHRQVHQLDVDILEIRLLAATGTSEIVLSLELDGVIQQSRDIDSGGPVLGAGIFIACGRDIGVIRIKKRKIRHEAPADLELEIFVRRHHLETFIVADGHIVPFGKGGLNHPSQKNQHQDIRHNHFFSKGPVFKINHFAGQGPVARFTHFKSS